MGFIACSLGGVSIYTYGLFVAVAVLLAVVTAGVNVRLHHQPAAVLTDIVLWGIPLALLCGRAGYVLHHFEQYSSCLWEIVAIWHGGLSLYGIIGGLLLAVWGVCQVHGLDTWQWLDILIPAGVLALVIIELGIFALQLNPGLPFPDDLPNDHRLVEYVEYAFRPVGFGDTLYFQPIALYQAGLQLLVFLLLCVLTVVQLVWQRPRLLGTLFLLGTASLAFIRLGCGFYYLASGADIGAAMPLGRVMSGSAGMLAVIVLILRKRFHALKNN
ncbi:phosphatidylglycerol:prolipoprotein diacylglycerol transferase [Selenomonas sp. GACV-9]|uniref:prolipoprotein diacylglyceryl transferase family protein n=1 Tax=Selenomonas sp. GACV-9 TaxID=3158782 RepID=UPI0008E39565|nr:phosphatidylglycerol:prolipoprotein diacylglycerol transferase [Selenomonas ruminantium]